VWPQRGASPKPHGGATVRTRPLQTHGKARRGFLPAGAAFTGDSHHLATGRVITTVQMGVSHDSVELNENCRLRIGFQGFLAHFRWVV
jgi:hypothetical protein